MRGYTIESVREAVEVLNRGGLVIAPTDSVYGLFCNALDGKAVGRIKDVKGRDKDKPLQVAVRKRDAGKYGVIKPAAEKVIKRFWPGDVNIIVRKRSIIPDFISKETVCLTCHSNPVARKLVELTRKPLVSTSANFSGEKPPVSVGEINAKLAELVDLVIDGGETKNRKPNTILDTTVEPARIVRRGSVSAGDLRDFIKVVE